MQLTSVAFPIVTVHQATNKAQNPLNSNQKCEGKIILFGAISQAGHTARSSQLFLGEARLSVLQNPAFKVIDSTALRVLSSA